MFQMYRSRTSRPCSVEKYRTAITIGMIASKYDHQDVVHEKIACRQRGFGHRREIDLELDEQFRGGRKDVPHVVDHGAEQHHEGDRSV